MYKPSPSPTGELLALSNPKVVAICLAAGGQLVRVEEGAGGRLVFHLAGLPADFLTQLTNDQVQVSARAVVTSMESVLGMIAERRRR